MKKKRTVLIKTTNVDATPKSKIIIIPEEKNTSNSNNSESEELLKLAENIKQTYYSNNNTINRILTRSILKILLEFLQYHNYKNVSHIKSQKLKTKL